MDTKTAVTTSMNPTYWMIGIEVIQFLFLFIVGLWQFVGKAPAENKRRLEEAEEDIQELRERMVVVENLPSHDDFVELSNQVSSIKATLKSNTAKLDRIDQYFMGKAS